MLIAFNKRHNGHNLVYSKLYQKKHNSKNPKKLLPKIQRKCKNFSLIYVITNVNFFLSVSPEPKNV